MSEAAKRLRDRRLNVWRDCKKIADDAADENRAMTPDEMGRWDAMQEELGYLDIRIKAVLDTVKRGKEADEAYEAIQARQGRAVARGQEAVPDVPAVPVGEFVVVSGVAPGLIRSNIRCLKRNGASDAQVTAILLDTETDEADSVSFSRGTVALLKRHGLSAKQIVAVLLDTGDTEEEKLCRPSRR